MLHFLSGKTGKKRKCNYNEDAVAALIIFIAKVICIGIPVPISLSLMAKYIYKDGMFQEMKGKK